MDMNENEDTKQKHVELGAVSVSVQNVTVKYHTQTSDRVAFDRAGFLQKVGYRLLGRRPNYVVNALRGISFVARQGESIGLVGLNGSGKSTLLRVIAGAEPPSSGEVRAASQPILLGVSAALLPELSGLQNVRIGCLAMGLTPKQTEDAIPHVVSLANLGDAIYLPMKTYSSGMASRLRFAIATASKPEVLLIDEALNTGDAAFKERSESAMNEMREAAGTVFLVSHAAQTIETMCTRAIWLHLGRIIADGDAQIVARHYRIWSWNVAKGNLDHAEETLRKAADQFEPSKNIVATDLSPNELPRHAF